MALLMRKMLGNGALVNYELITIIPDTFYEYGSILDGTAGNEFDYGSIA